MSKTEPSEEAMEAALELRRCDSPEVRETDYGQRPECEIEFRSEDDRDCAICWRNDDDYALECSYMIGDGDRDYEERSKAELTRIVRCVNAHDDLVEALELAASFVRARASHLDGAMEAGALPVIDAALSVAKGDTTDEDV